MSQTPTSPAGPTDAHIRLATSRDESGNIEIYSCATKTALVLPPQDADLLIGLLLNRDRTSCALETVCLDPSCEIYGTEKKA